MDEALHNELQGADLRYANVVQPYMDEALHNMYGEYADVDGDVVQPYMDEALHNGKKAPRCYQAVVQPYMDEALHNRSQETRVSKHMLFSPIWTRHCTTK